MENVSKYAILQTGLYSNWILTSTLSNVVACNPSVRFDYVGLFQTNPPAYRYSDNIIRTGDVNVDRYRGMLRKHRVRVVLLATVHMPDAPIPPSFRNRRDTFVNDVRQLLLIERASEFLPQDVDYVLRVREDAGWYHPFSLPFPSIMVFNDCRPWNGINDKVWLGPTADVLRVHRNLISVHATVQVGRGSTEEILAYVVAQQNVSYTVSTIPVSDARRRRNHSLCWTRPYVCSKSVPQCPSSWLSSGWNWVNV